jgi:hypothetical protein
MKKVYLAIIKNRYLKVGLSLVVIGAILAVYLNNEGVKCLSDLNRSGNMSSDNTQRLKGNCFFITNSYVRIPTFIRYLD